MRFLRLLLAGLVAVLAVGAVLLTACMVVFTGLAAYLAQLFRRPAGPDRPTPSPARPARMRRDDAIDVVTTNLPADPPGR